VIPISDPPIIPPQRAEAPPGVSLAAAGGLPESAQAKRAVPLNGPTPDPGFLLPLVRDRWMGASSRGWTPDRVELVLRSALSGDHASQWELFDLMEDTWPRLLKNLGEIKRAVTKMSWTVLPWAEDDAPPTPEATEKAAAVSRALWLMRPNAAEAENGFMGTVFDLLDAWGKVTVALEVDWQTRMDKGGPMVVPRATHWVHPNFYGWSSQGWLGLRTGADRETLFDGQQSASGIIPFPEHKFIIGIARAKSGHPLGTALLRPLAWWWCAANFSAEWWLNFAQLFGVPIRWANYATATDANTQAKISEMLRNMGSAAYGMFPEGVTLQILESAKGASGSNPQEALLNTADRLCDILFLGQTLTTDVGASGSLALGTVHSGVRGEILCAAGDWVAETLTQQLVASICELTWGNRDQMPELVAEPRKAEDAKANAERDKLLLDAGVTMPANWFRERHEIPHPIAGEEVIGGHKPTPASPAGFLELPPAQAKRTDGESSDRTAQQKLAERIAEETTGVERKWLGGALPWFRDLVAAVQNEKLSDGQLIEFLEARNKAIPEELGPLIDIDALAGAMERNMGASAINGAVASWMKRRNGPGRKGKR